MAKLFCSRISCKCAEAAKAQGFAGYAIHYGGQCYGRTKDQVTALMKKEHINQICYGEQIYVDCLKDEHSHCMGKENAEAVYQFIDSAEESEEIIFLEHCCQLYNSLCPYVRLLAKKRHAPILEKLSLSKNKRYPGDVKNIKSFEQKHAVSLDFIYDYITENNRDDIAMKIFN